MYVFKTTTVVESIGFPGVTLTVKKMTEDRRDALRLALSTPLAKLELRGEELRQLSGRKDPESDARRNAIVSECAQIENTELIAIKMSWGLKAINGLGIDTEENTATVEEWRKWPSELVAEVIGMIDRASGLSAPDIKNSSSSTQPGDSASPETSDTIAPSAYQSGSTSPETAAASTQTN